MNAFLLRWTLANMLGWSLGLYAGGALLSVLGGIGGALAGGALAGAVVGAAQWLALRYAQEHADPRWALVSAAGGGLAVLPAYLSGVTLLAGPQVGYFIVGAVYGGIFGGLQAALVWRDWAAGSGLWLAGNIIAGGLCGCLMMTASLPGLPVICSPGPVVFGLLTGGVLQWLRRVT